MYGLGSSLLHLVRSRGVTDTWYFVANAFGPGVQRSTFVVLQLKPFRENLRHRATVCNWVPHCSVDLCLLCQIAQKWLCFDTCSVYTVMALAHGSRSSLGLHHRNTSGFCFPSTGSRAQHGRQHIIVSAAADAAPSTPSHSPSLVDNAVPAQPQQQGAPRSLGCV